MTATNNRYTTARRLRRRLQAAAAASVLVAGTSAAAFFLATDTVYGNGASASATPADEEPAGSEAETESAPSSTSALLPTSTQSSASTDTEGASEGAPLVASPALDVVVSTVPAAPGTGAAPGAPEQIAVAVPAPSPVPQLPTSLIPAEDALSTVAVAPRGIDSLVPSVVQSDPAALTAPTALPALGVEAVVLAVPTGDGSDDEEGADEGGACEHDESTPEDCAADGDGADTVYGLLGTVPVDAPVPAR